MRTMLIATLLGLAACGGANPEAACEDYAAAADACITALGDDSVPSPVADGFCDGYSGLKGDEAKAAEDYLLCLADAYGAADCSTIEGLTAASDAALGCTTEIAE